MLCEVLILLVTFVADKSLFLRKRKPIRKLIGFFIFKNKKTNDYANNHLGYLLLRIPSLGTTQLIPHLKALKHTFYKPFF